MLRRSRPLTLPTSGTPDAELPPVPRDGFDGIDELSPSQVAEESMGEMGSQPIRQGRSGGGSSSAFRTPRSWRQTDGVWKQHQSEGRMPDETHLRTEGPANQVGSEEEKNQGATLEQALEREMVELLVKQNQQLQQELKELKEMKSHAGTSSWSEVTPVEPQTPVTGGNRIQSRFTPGGTKVPDDTPPRNGWCADEMVGDQRPPPPPQLPDFPDFKMYELHHERSGCRGKTMGSWQWVLSTEVAPQPPIWPTPAEEIEEAARLLNARTREREAAHQGRAFDGHGGLPHQDRALHLHGAGAHQDRALHLHGAGAHQDRALHLHGAGAHQDRAVHLHGAGAHQDRAWPEHGAESHQDRAWQLHGPECHRDRARASMMDGDLRDSRGLWQGLHDGGVAGQDQFEGGTKQLHHQSFGESQGGGTRVDLPPLPTSLTPMDLGDWLTLIGPILRDITPQSAVWWELTMKQAYKFYEEWRTSSPVQRVKITPVLPAELLKPIFARTEQRGVGLLLKAVSEDLRRILISNRDMNSTSLVWRLLITFQPGGSGEKGQLLEVSSGCP